MNKTEKEKITMLLLDITEAESSDYQSYSYMVKVFKKKANEILKIIGKIKYE